jgi:hypothetical protein
MAYIDKKGTFHGTIEELQDKILDDLENYTPEERENLRRAMLRFITKRKTSDGEWFN